METQETLRAWIGRPARVHLGRGGDWASIDGELRSMGERYHVIGGDIDAGFCIAGFDAGSVTSLHVGDQQLRIEL